jgi:hypothetical protein
MLSVCILFESLLVGQLKLKYLIVLSKDNKSILLAFSTSGSLVEQAHAQHQFKSPHLSWSQMRYSRQLL